MANPADVAALAQARAQVQDLQVQLRTMDARLRALQVRLDNLVASGGLPDRIDALRQQIDDLTARRDSTQQLLDDARALVRELVERIAAQDQVEAFIGALDGHVPVALLPVRIETRYADGATALHVRIFPDQVHVDAHEPELTDVELAAGRAYWERRWAAPDDRDEARAAWLGLAGGRRPTRARWIADVTTPANPLGAAPGPDHPQVAVKPGTWTRPARAVALPARWVAIGRRGSEELFRVWSGPVTEHLEVAPGPDDDPSRVLGAEGLRWLTDPEAARQAGVLLTVRDADVAGGARLRDGIDELVVLGVTGTQSPEDGAQALSGLLAAHVYGDGLAFVPQGTPTNNTAEVAAGHTTDRSPLVDALDPARTDAEETDPAWSAGPRLAAALGLAAPPAGAPDSALAEHAVASALLDATWEATAGTYLGQLLRPVGRIRPFISDSDIDQLRLWAAAHLFASGPLPLVRIGRQPYGVLPVVDPARYQPPPGDRAAQLVGTTTAKVRRWWDRGVTAVPRLDGAPDLDAAIVALLQRAPVAAAARFRRVFPPGAVFNILGFDDLAQQQNLHGWVVESMFEGQFSPQRLRIGTLTTDPRSHPLRIPWARPAGLDAGAALPYAGALRDLVGAAGGRDALAARGGATSLAEALLALSAALELDAAHGRVIKDFATSQGATSPLVDAVRVRHPDTIGVGIEDGPVGALAFATPKVLADAQVPGLTGTGTVAELVRDQIRDGSGTGAAPAVDGVRRLIAALDRLRNEPGERVEWALRGLLDLYAYRLDAWCTALATQRLADLRRARPHGVHLGCYGWVEGLRPDPPGRDSLGYVHTPSVTHAVAAAVLRSGHVAHRSTAQQALAIDLSARRVRDAMAVLDGVETGQPLGALIGYRIERLLRQRDAVLMRYVLPLRRLAPLRHTDADLSEPVEAIAARDVVDGVALLEQWRAGGGRDAVLAAAGVLPTHRAAVAATLDAADDVFDAIGDVLLSEAVYQTIAGNQERASAALAALDRQQRPVRPYVVQTPRSGTTLTHRVVVLLSAANAPEWDALSLTDPRGDAEPRLNAWVARLLGPPGSIVFAAEVRRGGVVRATVSAGAAELGLSPLALVLAARRAAADQPSELESRIARVLAAKVLDGTEEDQLALAPDPPAGAAPGTWGLDAVRTVARWVERLGARRPASGNDLQPLLHDEAGNVDVAELAVRADRAVAALAHAIAASGSAALDEAARLGIPDALPESLSAASDGQVARVLAKLRAAADQLAAEDAAFAGIAAPSLDQQVEHQLRRVRIVLGEAFPALPIFRPPDLTAALADRDALLAGDGLAPLPWLHRVALVRPAVDPLSSLLTAAEANGRDLALPRLEVVQLPPQQGQRWMALPTPPGTDVPEGAVGIVAHAPDGIGATGATATAGLVVDEWTETIPSAAETTALSFHYDAPASQPPQAILLAVPGAPDTATWSFDELLGAVREAIALTHLRAVGPRELPDLGGYLPALYLPQDVTGDVPTTDLFDLAQRAQRAGALPGVLGKG